LLKQQIEYIVASSIELKNEMNKQLVTKDNSLIGASYSLGVVEQRLIFLAIIEAREQNTLIEAGGLLRIYAQSYARQFEVEKHTSYEAMKRAVEGLYEAGFSYSKVDEKSGKIGQYKSRWVDKIGYIDDLGCVELVFASDVIPLITRLEERYTAYELKQVAGLQSEYAIRLYELIIQWRSVGKTNQMPLDELRSKLGLTKEYPRIEAFKRRVLDVAIKQINTHTDITAEYEQHKQGRMITGFTFKFEQKKMSKNTKADKSEGKLDIADIFNGLTDNEHEIVLATANKYLNQKKITDPMHKENIYKKAVKERWGLEEVDKQAVESQLQNERVNQEIEAERLAQKSKEQEKAKQQQDNEQFIYSFEKLPATEQREILKAVEDRVKDIPIVNNQFMANRETAYKDIMFRSYFKIAMNLDID